MNSRLLSSIELKGLASGLPEWELKGNKLTRNFHFDNFIEAFGFMTKVAIFAESICHHPEWSNIYSNVNITLTTHDLGGISTLDIKLAETIDKLSSIKTSI